MNGRNARAGSLIIAVFIISILQPGIGHSAKPLQSGIKSWFNMNNERDGSARTNVDKSRKNAITNAISDVSPSVANISISLLPKSPGQDYKHYFIEAEKSGALRKVGSGFVIHPKGKIVTNAHILLKSSREQIIVSFNSGMSYLAEITGIDTVTNIALLSVQTDKTREFPTVAIEHTKNLMVGEWSIAMGNPFGLMEQGNPTVNVGVISTINRTVQMSSSSGMVYSEIIETDAGINDDNTGGPLINSMGKVIGMNTFLDATDYGSINKQNMEVVIPIERVIGIADVLDKKNKINLNFDTGLQYKLIDLQVSKKHNLSVRNGLLVTAVNKDGPAYHCGIMPGDIIRKFGDTRVQSEVHALAILQQYEVGDQIDVELIRDAQKYRTTMVLRPKTEVDTRK